MSDSEHDRDSTLFAMLMMQQSNMAMMTMGKMPDPSTGKTHINLEQATLFIDMLAMLETRTKGNLSDDESNMLKETVSHLRMMYVDATKAPATSEAVSKPDVPSEGGAPEEAPAQPAAEASSDASAATTPPEQPVEESKAQDDSGDSSSPAPEKESAPEPEAAPESKKKFTKKY